MASMNSKKDCIGHVGCAPGKSLGLVNVYLTCLFFETTTRVGSERTRIHINDGADFHRAFHRRGFPLNIVFSDYFPK